MTTQQAIEALHALPRMGQGAPGLARMQNLCDLDIILLLVLR